MSAVEIDWISPITLSEALEAKAAGGEELTVLAGGTFVGVLVNQGFLSPVGLLDLSGIEELVGMTVTAEGELRIGAMTRHRAVERSAEIRQGWPVLARAFGLVASPRIRNVATVGGVLADADYASDPPAVLVALGARVLLRSSGGQREVEVRDLILGHYETCIEPNELLVEVRIPPAPTRAAYRKFRTRSSEDRPCVAVAATRNGDVLRVVVGAVAGRPQMFEDVCSLPPGGGLDADLAARIADAYARRIEPISDSRGSAEYRRRITRVEVRRALEEIL